MANGLIEILFRARQGEFGEPLPPAVMTVPMRASLEQLGRSDFSYYRGIADEEPRHKRRELDAGVMAGITQVERWLATKTLECDIRIKEIETELPWHSTTPVTPVTSEVPTGITVDAVQAAYEERREQRRTEQLREMSKEQEALKIRKQHLQDLADLAVDSWASWWQQVVETYADAASIREVRAIFMKDVPEPLLPYLKLVQTEEEE